MPRRWHQVGGAIRRRRWQQSPVTGKSTKETVKTIARGMPGEAGVTVVTMLVCFFILHARLRARRAPGIPCALILLGRTIHASLGRRGVAGTKRRVYGVSGGGLLSGARVPLTSGRALPSAGSLLWNAPCLR